MKQEEKKVVAGLDEYHYDEQDIANRAMENLGKNKEYRKLLDQYDAAKRQRNFVKQTQLNLRIVEMKQQEVHRLVDLEESKRKSVKGCKELLKRVNMEDYYNYKDMMSVLAFLLDITDTTFTEINKLLRRNNTGVEMNNFPEFKAARKVAWDMTADEQREMQSFHNDLFADETERLFGYLLSRATVLRHKVEREERKRGLPTD